MLSFNFAPIGFVRCPFREKFGLARQSMMLKNATGYIQMSQDKRYRRALEELQSFSHIWIIFVFHKDTEKEWRPTIMTPRVEAGRQVGVLATRSPNRPNPIGMSVVKLEKINFKSKSGIEIHVSGIDLLDGTPVLDIKPYLPYADKIPNANSGWATEEIERYEVQYSPASLRVLESIKQKNPRAKKLLTEILELDPRPTSQRKKFPLKNAQSQGKIFAFRFLEFDVRCELRAPAIYVKEIIPLKNLE